MTDAEMSAMRPGLRLFALVLTVALTATACGGGPSVLDGVADDAARIERLWWVMLAVSAVVFAVVMWLLVGSIVRSRNGRPRRGAGESMFARRTIIWGGLIGPAIILTGVFGLATADLRAISTDRDSSLDVVVTGWQWWWEVEYPDAGVVTANEIHVPTGERVRFILESEDVIHSFWVPQAGPKRDMIPGTTNELLLTFDEPGEYIGVCAEFCGLQHAHMQILVIAEQRDQFDDWLAAQAEPADSPSGDQEKRGEEAFLNGSCVGCHTIRGVSDSGGKGPDLTHLADRTTIGAALIDLNHENLLSWVSDPGVLKPGVRMPPAGLDADDLAALVAYLESLR